MGSTLALLNSTFNAKTFIWSIASDFGAVYSWNACGSLNWRTNSIKTRTFGAHGCSRSSMLVLPESSSAAVVMMRSKCVPIGNRSGARLVDSRRNRAFWMGHPNLMHSYVGLREARGSKLHRQSNHPNLRLKPKISYAWCWSISNGIGATHSGNVYRSLK